MIPMDDRDGWIWLDGTLQPWREASLHVLTHGLHYGSTVFEGERVYGGRVFEIGTHTRRLVNSARIMGMNLAWGEAELDEATRATVAANGIGDGYVRRFAWRGSEQLAVGAPLSTIHVAIATWVWPSYFADDARNAGIRLAMADWRRPPPACAPCHAKASGLYMVCTLARHAAEAAGYDDAMMLDWQGRIAEATGANVFFVRDGALHTPTPDCFLDGITRRTVIGLARANGIDVIERTILPDELAGFTECFLTGSAAEITPVHEIAGTMFKPGRVTRAVSSAYADLVRSEGGSVLAKAA